jgi:hypothetical protein
MVKHTFFVDETKILPAIFDTMADFDQVKWTQKQRKWMVKRMQKAFIRNRKDTA